MKTEEEKSKEAEEMWKKIDKRKGKVLQGDKDFYGYTVLTILFNNFPIRLVREEDALKVIEDIFKQSKIGDNSEVKE
jgi:hypothetical protein